LPEILLFEEQTLAQQIFAVPVASQYLKDPAHCNSHAANARLSTALA